MVDGIVMAGMIFALTMSFAISVVALMYMLIKKKQRNVPTLVLTGGMAVIAGPLLVRLILEYLASLFVDFKDLSNNNFAVYVLITVLFITITIVAALTVFLYVLEPGGLTVNRVIVFATAVQMFYSLLFTALNMYNKLTVAMYINSDDIDKLTSETAEVKKSVNETIDYYSNLKAMDFFSEGVCQILFFIIIVAAALYIYKGMYEKTIAKNIAIVTIYIFVKEIGYQLLSHYVNSIIGAVYYAVFAAGAFYFTRNIIKDNVKIKPKSMREDAYL